MKNTIKTFVNQIKKALDNKSCIMLAGKAYANNNGDVIVHSFKDNTEIFLFVAGIVEDIEKRNKLYDKDTLSLAANTGIFAGGVDLPDDNNDYYKIPECDFVEALTINADELKAAAFAASVDNTRPVLTSINITPGGMIQSCDGFRAYIKPGKAINPAALSGDEINNGLMIPAAVVNYGFKGDLTIYNSETYIKVIDSFGVCLYLRKTNKGNYINLEQVYNGYGKKVSGKARITDKKTFAAVLKTAIATKDGRGRGSIVIKARNGFIDYYIKALDLFGSIAADVEIETPAEYNLMLNPKYVYDAVINQGGEWITFPDSMQAPIFVTNNEGVNALLLPIRDDNRYYFSNYPAADDNKANQETPAPDVCEDKPADDMPDVCENREETPAAAADIPDVTPEKLEIVKREELPPEIVKARKVYQELKRVNYTPDEYTISDMEIIYKNNRDKLAPIARRAGGLFIDNLSIIAAIMAIYEELK